MNDPWVKDYLTHRVIDFMIENNFEYIKVDYNETIGIGCDDEDSLGEGLRKNMLGTVDFFKRIRDKIPGVIIESCASGGHRLEPCFTGLSSMSSFSDAHECVEIPIIAANLHRAMLPRQSQIWCVIRKTDTLKRIAYSITAATLGRLCLSGDVTDLNDEQWSVIDNGIAFYKKAMPIIKNGRSFIYSDRSASDRHPRGYQAVVRKGENETLVTVHTFGGEMPKEIRIPADAEKIKAQYSHCKPEVYLCGGDIVIKAPENFVGYAFIV
jgi:alpha-galactosidase